MASVGSEATLFDNQETRLWINRLLVKASVPFFQRDFEWRSQFGLIIHAGFRCCGWAAGGCYLFIYLFPEGSVTSPPPTQTSQALLAAGGTEQESARRAKKKKKEKKKRGSASDGGVERMRGDTVCGQHLFILDGCVELRGRDAHMTAWGNVLDVQSCVRDLVTLFFCLKVTHQRSTVWLKLDWEVWTLSNDFVCFFAASFGKRVQIRLLMSSWLHPLPSRTQGIWLLFLFLCSTSESLHANAVGNAKVYLAGSVTSSRCLGLWFLSQEIPNLWLFQQVDVSAA